MENKKSSNYVSNAEYNELIEKIIEIVKNSDSVEAAAEEIRKLKRGKNK